jgi:hypothetical protein
MARVIRAYVGKIKSAPAAEIRARHLISSAMMIILVGPAKKPYSTPNGAKYGIPIISILPLFTRFPHSKNTSCSNLAFSVSIALITP